MEEEPIERERISLFSRKNKFHPPSCGNISLFAPFFLYYSDESSSYTSASSGLIYERSSREVTYVRWKVHKEDNRKKDQSFSWKDSRMLGN